MDEIELQVDKREVLGKKVKTLRRQGVTPTHIFGHGIESVALQCDTANLRRILAEAGQTRLINLKLANERSPRAVVIREIQKDPLTNELLHVDFYQVRMGEKVTVEIPVVIIGESPALKSRENMLVQELNSLAIECLPAKIPPSIRLDIGSLTETEQAIRVKDIELDEEITVLRDSEMVVVKIIPRPIDRIEEAVAEEVVETAEAAPSSEENPTSE